MSGVRGRAPRVITPVLVCLLALSGCQSQSGGEEDSGATTSPVAELSDSELESLLLTPEQATAAVPDLGELHVEFRGAVEAPSEDSAPDGDPFLSEDPECQAYFDETAQNPHHPVASLAADNHDTGFFLTEEIYAEDPQGLMAVAAGAQDCPEYAIGEDVVVTTEALNISIDGWDVVADEATVAAEGFPDSTSASAFAGTDDVVLAVYVSGGEDPQASLQPLLEAAVQTYVDGMAAIG